MPINFSMIYLCHSRTDEGYQLLRIAADILLLSVGKSVRAWCDLANMVPTRWREHELLHFHHERNKNGKTMSLINGKAGKNM